MGRRTVVMLAFVTAFFVFAGFAHAQEAPPASEAPGGPVIAEGVTIGSVGVGGMTAVQAEAAVKASYERPLRLVFRKKRWQATPAQLGARPALASALGRALSAAPGARVELAVHVKGRKVRRYVARLDRSFSRPAVDSEIRLLNYKPRLTKARDGVRVNRLEMTKAILGVLRTSEREPLPLAHTLIEPETTQDSDVRMVVIRRESKRLVLYEGTKRVRSFKVAVGLDAYPTPLGKFDVITKQVDPTWIPPNSVWAKGLEPVGPGYGNPLGTRWMGISSPAIGIHGTYDQSSVGTAASHGCIRMSIDEAEWLFENIDLGTPIWIVKK